MSAAQMPYPSTRCLTLTVLHVQAVAYVSMYAPQVHYPLRIYQRNIFFHLLKKAEKLFFHAGAQRNLIIYLMSPCHASDIYVKECLLKQHQCLKNSSLIEHVIIAR